MGLAEFLSWAIVGFSKQCSQYLYHMKSLSLDALLDALADRIVARLNGNGAAPTPAPEQADRLLTVSEAATRLGVSKRYVYAHVAAYPLMISYGGSTVGGFNQY